LKVDKVGVFRVAAMDMGKQDKDGAEIKQYIGIKENRIKTEQKSRSGIC
jgi:hypothetical protein